MGRYATIECDRCGKTRGPREHEWRAWVEITVHGPLADVGGDEEPYPLVLCAACWQVLMHQDDGGYIQPLTGYRLYLWRD